MRMTPRISARASCFTLLTLFGLVTAGTAWAQDGRVNFVSGEARVERGGKTQSLGKNDLIHSGDTIITGDTGRVQLRMSDDAVIAIIPNTRFKIEEYRAPSTGGGGKSIYALLEGGMGFISGLIGKKDPAAFAVKTPVATMGIRGSRGNLKVCKGGCRTNAGAAVKDGGYLHTINGSLSFSNADGGVDVAPGQVAHSASPPVMLSPGDPGFIMMLEFSLSIDAILDTQIDLDAGITLEPEIVNSPN